MECTCLGIALVLLTLGVTAFMLLLWRFVSWRPNRWAVAVKDHYTFLQSEVEALKPRPPQSERDAQDRIWAEHFSQYLRKIPVDRLAEFPGIGPTTVDRLRQAGGRTLADLPGFDFMQLPQIGPAKAEDLTAAADQLIAEARQKFESGNSPELQAARRDLLQWREQMAREDADRERQLQATLRAVRETERLLPIVREITLRRFLIGRPIPGWDDSLFEKPLPRGEWVEVVVPSAPPGVRVLARPSAPPAPPPKPLPPPRDLFADALQAKPAPAAAVHPWFPKLRAVVRFAIAVARADGRVSKAERKIIREFLAARLGQEAELVRQFDPLMEKTEKNPPSEAEALDELCAVTEAADRPELLRFAGQILDAGGGRSDREKQALARIAARLGVELSPAPPPPAPPTPPPQRPVTPDPKAVLEIAAETAVTVALVRRQYARLSANLDKATELGGDFAKLAEAKRGELKAAAEALLRPLGEPLAAPEPPPPPGDIRHNPDLDDIFGV